MHDKITVIITIRNRDTLRIEKQINSIRSAGATPVFHIVDYGSDEFYTKQYSDLCTKQTNLHNNDTHTYAPFAPMGVLRGHVCGHYADALRGH